MIVCRKCSRRHPDGTEFCVCGAYLEFDGEHVAEAGDVRPAAPPSPPPPAPGRPAPPPQAGAWSVRPAEPAPPAAPPRSAADPAPWSGFEAAREPSRPPGGIDAVLPDAPTQSASTQPVWVDAGAREGEIPCRQCGTPNPPERFFCRHCGVSLTGAVDPATTPPPRKLPWWKRIFRRAKTRSGSPDAMGMMYRAQNLARGGMSARTLLFRSGGIMVILAGALAFLGPWRGTVLAKGRQLLGAEKYSAYDVGPDEASAVTTDSATVPAVFELQGPENVVDRFANTAWATRWIATGGGFEEPPPDGECQPIPSTDAGLVFEFTEARDIKRIRILGGRTEGDEGRTLFARPRVLEVQLDDGPCRYALVDDVGELIDIGISGDDVERVAIAVVGIYPADPPSEVVEISELVFEH